MGLAADLKVSGWIVSLGVSPNGTCVIKVTNPPFRVKVVLPAAGGIYPDASVTYRGIDVGKVASLQLKPNVADR